MTVHLVNYSNIGIDNCACMSQRKHVDSFCAASSHYRHNSMYCISLALILLPTLLAFASACLVVFSGPGYLPVPVTTLEKERAYFILQFMSSS